MAQLCSLGATGEIFEVPAWTRIQQRFDSTALDDVVTSVRDSLTGAGILLQPGDSVALTVGKHNCQCCWLPVLRA